jgi:hypothetical protein
MKSFLTLIILIAFAFTSTANDFEEKGFFISSIDLKAGRLGFKPLKAPKLKDEVIMNVTKRTKVFIFGKKGQLTDLKVGDSVHLFYTKIYDEKKQGKHLFATRIETLKKQQ